MSFDGTVSGTLTFVPGKFGEAVSGAPSGTVATVPAGAYGASPVSFTIEMWLQTTATSTQGIVAFPSLPMYLQDGRLTVSFPGGSNYSNIINDGAWHHVAIVYYIEASSLSVFIDGSRAFSVPLQAALSSESQIQDGGGAIDELAFWVGARYAANFTLRTTPYAGTETGLQALYHFDGDATDSCIAVVVTEPSYQSLPGEFQIDQTWSAIQALLTSQLGDSVNVDCVGAQDFDEQGDLTIEAPAARVLFIDEQPGDPVETQAQAYNSRQYFAVICAAEDLSGVQSQRIASAQLAGQVKHILVGARIALEGGILTEPVEFKGVAPLATAALGMAYVASFCVPNIAQFSAPNAYPSGGN